MKKIFRFILIALASALPAATRAENAPIIQPPAVLQVCPYCVQLNEVVNGTLNQVIPGPPASSNTIFPVGTQQFHPQDFSNRLREAIMQAANFKLEGQLQVAMPAPNPAWIGDIVRSHSVCKGITLAFGPGSNVAVVIPTTPNPKHFMVGAVCDGQLVDLDAYALEAVNSLRVAYGNDVTRLEDRLSEDKIKAMVADLVGKTKLDEARIVEAAAQRTVVLLKPKTP